LSFDFAMSASAPEPNLPPQVFVQSPARGFSATAPATLALEAAVFDANNDVELVEFFANGVKVGESAIVPYTVAWPVSVPGRYDLTARATDRAGASTMSAPLTGRVHARLVAPGGFWRYHDQGIDLGAVWRSTQYGDAAWPGGPAPLGYGDGNEATLVSYGGDEDNKHLTT
jgi:hypothetical protein